MTDTNCVVVHFLRGEILKGITNDFRPNRRVFHVEPPNGGKSVAAHLELIKAVFFVRTFEGDLTRDSLPGFRKAPPLTPKGKKVAVLFKDGELICGYTLGYVPGRQGFFLTPADPKSNNMRIYVLEESAKDIQTGSAADLLVEAVLDGQSV